MDLGDAVLTPHIMLGALQVGGVIASRYPQLLWLVGEIAHVGYEIRARRSSDLVTSDLSKAKRQQQRAGAGCETTLYAMEAYQQTSDIIGVGASSKMKGSLDGRGG